MSYHSFKPQFTTGSHVRFRTPSPPRDAIEPLTPFAAHTRPVDYETTQRYERGRSQHTPQKERRRNYALGGDETESEDDTRGVHTSTAQRSYESAARVYAQPIASPIDKLASVALATSPTYSPRSHHYRSHAHQPQPAPSYWAHSDPYYQYPSSTHPRYGIEERPTKRARSEVLASPRQFQSLSRPVTSYHPSGGWSFDVNEQAHSGYQVDPYQPSGNGHGSDYQDAELLLFFKSGAADQAATSSGSHGQSGAWAHGWSATKMEPPTNAAQGVSEVSGQDNTAATWKAQDYQAQQQPQLLDTHSWNVGQEVTGVQDDPPAVTVIQTHTPPDDNSHSVPDGDTASSYDQPKKSHKGWPKGKPRGPRAKTGAKKTSKSTKTKDGTAASASTDAPEQLRSPQSLLEEVPEGASTRGKPPNEPVAETAPEERRRSLPQLPSQHNQSRPSYSGSVRSLSVPLDIAMIIRPVPNVSIPQTEEPLATKESTICAVCHFSPNSLSGEESRTWMQCDGCKRWFHFACAGFKERVVRTVDKFFCKDCKPKHGPTTYLRKSGRAHSDVDYASLNEGIVRTSDENPEHHYIQSFKDGSFKFQPETFPRMPPEMVTAEYFEKGRGMTEPIVIPAYLNPRPSVPGSDVNISQADGAERDLFANSDTAHNPPIQFEYERVPDDGQDKLDMVIPQGLTVRRVAELYGPEEKVEIIDVKSQESGGGNWNMRKWADYYEQEGEKPVRNVISLEVSASKLGRLIRRPKIVRDIDLQDWAWPEDEVVKGNSPRVQFYCLMSVADCYTDFHIDFGGSSVYYHIVKGKKTFFFIPPKKQHLKKYEAWCVSPSQNWTFLPQQTGECYRVDLSEGDTMLIPSGWIHAVWTPENSLVIGGNFLTRMHYGMQLDIADIEKETKVPRKFRYPHFQKVMWYALLRYLEQDPLPDTVRQAFFEGKQFTRDTPTHLAFNKFGHNSDPGPENYHARYYSQAELDGLPRLLSYLFRTVMISMGRVEGITTSVRDAVTKSIPIPKGKGDPLEYVRTFAMWTAWKRGNEYIPEWALSEAALPEHSNSVGAAEKKLSTAALRKMERAAAVGLGERQSERQRSRALELNIDAGSGTGSPAPSSLASLEARYLSTPKTSVLGPKRTSCDTCRKRRIRCKHKDAVNATAESDGEMVVAPTQRRGSATMVAVVINRSAPAKPDAQITPTEPVTQPLMNGHALLPSAIQAYTAEVHFDSPDSKRSRSRACNDCRKSKRRCIHDEYGNVDPVKKAEIPVPRGSVSSKKRAMSGDGDAQGKRPKKHQTKAGHLPNGIITTDFDGDVEMMPRGPPVEPIEPAFQPGMVPESDSSLLDQIMVRTEDDATPTADLPEATVAPPLENPSNDAPTGIEHAGSVREEIPSYEPVPELEADDDPAPELAADHEAEAPTTNGEAPAPDHVLPPLEEPAEPPLPNGVIKDEQQTHMSPAAELVEEVSLLPISSPPVAVPPVAAAPSTTAAPVTTAPPPVPPPSFLRRDSTPLSEPPSDPPSPLHVPDTIIPTFESPKQSSRHSSRSIKPVERYSSGSYEAVKRQPSSSLTPAPTANGSVKSVSVSPEAAMKGTPASLSRKRSEKSEGRESRRGSKPGLGVVTAGGQDEASLRLIRELTSGEFGLRRRSK